VDTWVNLDVEMPGQVIWPDEVACGGLTWTASRRLSTYQLAQRFEALPVDAGVSDAWTLLVSRLRAAGQRVPINGNWIAATAIAHQVPIVTQDADYDGMPDLEVIRL
jgi:predicted nucleic acid-binding protein